VSTPPRHPLGHGACLLGCGIQLSMCVWCPPGCLVGAGTHSDAATIGGSATALQQQERGQQQQHCRRCLWRVLFPCVRTSLVGGSGGGCLPGSCLAAASTSSSLSSSFPPLFSSPSPSFPSPSFIHKSSRSLTWLSVLCEVDGGGGGLVGPTDTTRGSHGGGATPVRVAPQGPSVVVVSGVGAGSDEVVVVCVDMV
jgi:hypothetical protein